MWRFWERFQWAVAGMTCALVLGGCGGGGVKIRAADKMLKENPIKTIAIIGEGRIVYPRQSPRLEPLLCLAKSKESLSILLTQTKAELEEKGYKVVSCEPVGIGYYDPALRDNWVYEDYEHSEKRWQAGKEPGYEYPIVEKDPALRQAARRIFEGINKSLRAQSLSSYKPAPSDIAVLQKVTGADAIILERVHGQEFTPGRHVGAVMLELFVLNPGTHAEPHESVESFLICVEAGTGEVLWQHGLLGFQQPCQPAPSFMRQVLTPFPNIHEPVDPKYVAR